VSHAQETPDFDLDEDLFDFAGVVRESEAADPEEDLEEIFASFRDAAPQEELVSVPTAPASSPKAAAPPPTRAPSAAAPAPVREAHEPAPSRVAPAKAHAAPREPVQELTPAPRAPRFTKGVVAIALAVTVLNSVLALVVLRSGARDGAAHVGTDAAAAEHDAARPAPLSEPRTARLPDPETLDTLHAHPALDEARSEIARGEYSAARQRVYGLLAIIDRLDEPRRGALEADCRFLIAQALHLEALARMGAHE